MTEREKLVDQADDLFLWRYIGKKIGATKGNAYRRMQKRRDFSSAKESCNEG